MAKQKIDKSYVSDTDKFLTELDKRLPKSKSQVAEINKHKAVFAKRDGAVESSIHPKLKNF